MVDPDVGGSFQVNAVTLGLGRGELQVADDDVINLEETEASAGETRARADTEEGGVAWDTHSAAVGELAADLDNTTSLERILEFAAGLDGYTCTRTATGGLGTKANKFIDRGGTSLERSSKGGGASCKSESGEVDELHFCGRLLVFEGYWDVRSKLVTEG